MNIFHRLRDDVIAAANKIADVTEYFDNIAIETPKDPLHGDLSTNAAMILAPKLGSSPRDIAITLKESLQNLDYIAHIEIAGAGFINFTFKSIEWQNAMEQILKEGSQYGCSNIGAGQKVNIEYVSANPTGPMHIGHARGAVYGDALSRLLIKSGYDVTKEFYVNDAGSQAYTLARTVFLRYQAHCTGEKAVIPEGFYPGDYLIPVAKKLADKYGDKFLKQSEDEYLPTILEFAIAEMLQLIKNDLKELSIEHDIFFSEKSLHNDKKVRAAISKLEAQGLIYTGILPAPKGKIHENWEEKPQLLFKSTDFGDDQDRPLQKSDGSWTYFASDIAYAADKIARGFSSVVFVLGADHGGYVKRLEAIVKALSDGKVACVVKLCQLVNYLEDGKSIKMSKRSGNFTTVRDVAREVGKDIIRFIMLTRKNDIGLDFDLVKVKEQSKDNPVFYVQYAYVRSKSVIANIKEQLPEAYSIFSLNKYDLSLLSSEEEMQFIKLLASYSRVVEGAAKHFEPHRIAFYLQSVASSFHSLWNLGKENNHYRFIIDNEPALTAARLALVTAMINVIDCGFDIIGVDALEKM
jgi:arginyl-tRNA synthetase